MNKLKSIVLLFIFAITYPSSAQDLKLCYEKPDEEWTGGLPIGNGKLMGMVLGGVETDVNFGATSAIAEMLLQSHAGYVELLPVLSKELSTGSVKGLVARGGFEVEINWKDNQLENVCNHFETWSALQIEEWRQNH